jgi:hypothetical protein
MRGTKCVGAGREWRAVGGVPHRQPGLEHPTPMTPHASDVRATVHGQERCDVDSGWRQNPSGSEVVFDGIDEMLKV